MNTLTTHPTLSLILIISISIYGITGESSPSPVLDTDGDEVKPGVDYVMEASFYVPIPGASGGLRPATTGESPCPLDIIQDTLGPGLPLNFRPVNDQDTVVYTSTGVNIAFNDSITCNGSTSTAEWQMRYDGSLGKMVLTTGGEIGSPATDKSWFKLEQISPLLPFYNLVYCTSEHKCGDLLILRELGSKRHLVMPLTKSIINDIPCYVTITKASHNNNLSILELPA